MRMLVFIFVFLPFYLLTISVNAAPQALTPADVARDPAAKAIITFETAYGVRSIMFNQVLDTQSCFELAYTAAAKGKRESTATCLDARNGVVGTYSCDPSPVGASDPYCRAGFP